MAGKNTPNVLDRFYSDLRGKKRTAFRLKLCEYCGWTTYETFRRKRKGELKKHEIAAVYRIMNEI